MNSKVAGAGMGLCLLFGIVIGGGLNEFSTSARRDVQANHIKISKEIKDYLETGAAANIESLKVLNGRTERIKDTHKLTQENRDLLQEIIRNQKSK